jgi:hypothetical protein
MTWIGWLGWLGWLEWLGWLRLDDLHGISLFDWSKVWLSDGLFDWVTGMPRSREASASKNVIAETVIFPVTLQDVDGETKIERNDDDWDKQIVYTKIERNGVIIIIAKCVPGLQNVSMVNS